ncbi:hypothetical protein ABI_28130 [Asticcacaulis biprosthecium C19]|uniref:Uncharacterized protein n=1 Tax=Asticcacaulis biprosthecium C19 TaxID=715226 RepID=F4QMF6_9CAUL|nr:hypothetical protein ABI_28130 [Asticcacaulis biprosthecium C19]
MVAALCTFIILAHGWFPATASNWALGVLGIDIIGLPGTVVKLVFGASRAEVLMPVTRVATSHSPQP